MFTNYNSKTFIFAFLKDPAGASRHKKAGPALGSDLPKKRLRSCLKIGDSRKAPAPQHC